LERIAAVVVTYNNNEMLGRLMEDLMAQTRKLDEIIVVDNGETSEAEKIVKGKFGQAKYIKMSDNTGSAGGYHEGIKVACEHNDAVWLFDDDVSVNSDALEQLLVWLERLEEASKVGAVRSWSAQESPFTGVRRMDCFSWRGTFIKKEAIEKIGLPNVDYFLYGDDFEYSIRLQKSGYSIFWVYSSRVIEQRHFDKKRVSFLGMEISAYKDSAKLYYAFRNNVAIFISYRLWWQLAKCFLYAAKLIALFWLTGQKEKRRATIAVLSGIKYGCAGKLGISRQYTT
jgi:rhamnopyranosyl-N-acetylglucosaminyl-diphospho-decaprenol beta-1,3/1,4-galactofuranosyltransferase